jgi:hypothetical protein
MEDPGTWFRAMQQNTKTTLTWACFLCPNRKIFDSESELWKHAETAHREPLLNEKDLETFKKSFVADSALKRSGSVRPKHFRIFLITV